MGFRDPALSLIEGKLAGRTRLSREDGLALFASPDILGVGRLADRVRRARHGNRAYYIVNRQINPTNICVLSCKFCDFASKPGRPDAWEMTVDDVVGRCSLELREVHIVGGLNAAWPFERYLGLIAAIHTTYPSLQIKAWTAVEIDFFAKIAHLDIGTVLGRLQEAGLTPLPGGGAEVFSERVRKRLFPFKIGAPRWLQIHRAAHALGIRTNSTLLFGHIETAEERVDHMLRLRDLQDDTSGFMSFIPLEFQPSRNMAEMVTRRPPATEALRTIAVARLLLDNFDHIKAYWVMLGEALASVALHWGADALDGTIGEERVAHAADCESAIGQTRGAL